MMQNDKQADKPLISVIIPIYNDECWLKRCVDSVLDQTYANLEIILVDDGSTDASGRMCDEYGLKDKRVVVIHQENKSIAGARNTGLQNAKGEYLAFIDHDDWIHPQYFELLQHAIEESGCDISMCYYETVWTEDFKPDTRPIAESGTYLNFSRDQMIGGLLSIPVMDSRSSPVPYEVVWAKLHKREVLNGLYFRDVWGEDAEYNSRVYLRTENIVMVPHYLYSWIQSHGEAHRSSSPEGFEAYMYGPMAILGNISPVEYPVERALALKRMMLTILSSRYIVTKYKYYEKSKAAVMKLLGQIETDVVREFRSHRYISLGFKAALLTFYYLPFTYDAFRWLADKKARMSK